MSIKVCEQCGERIVEEEDVKVCVHCNGEFCGECIETHVAGCAEFADGDDVLSREEAATEEEFDDEIEEEEDEEFDDDSDDDTEWDEDDEEDDE